MRLVQVLAVLLAGANVASAKRFSHGMSMDEDLDSPGISNPNGTSLPEDKWFDQYLDQLNKTDTTTWKQRYFINDTFHKKGGPVFLMISGETTASQKSMLGGQWIEYAKQYGALCFQLEHRFYGKSRPTADLSVKNLAYLSSEQALGDLANFIEGMNTLCRIPPGTKWIAFGGSYGGSLAAWLRSKYPNLVHGAMSASAPLLAKVDFQEYFVVVADSLRTHSQDCVDAVVTANREIREMLRDVPLGPKDLGDLFRLCDPISPDNTTDNDIAILYSSIASYFAYAVQYNNISSNRLTIDSICNIMVDEKRGPPVARLAIINNLFINNSGSGCLGYKYSKIVNELKNVTWEAANGTGVGGRQWAYQTCTEFGFFQTSTARPKLFSETISIDLYIQECIDMFGPRYNAELVKSGVDRTNKYYGGLELDVTNVVHVHGSTDPWHKLGITKSSNPKAPAIFIEGTGHAAILYVESKSDPPQLIQARKDVGQLIGQWVKNGETAACM